MESSSPPLLAASAAGYPGLFCSRRPTFGPLGFTRGTTFRARGSELHPPRSPPFGSAAHRAHHRRRSFHTKDFHHPPSNIRLGDRPRSLDSASKALSPCAHHFLARSMRWIPLRSLFFPMTAEQHLGHAPTAWSGHSLPGPSDLTRLATIWGDVYSTPPPRSFPGLGGLSHYSPGPSFGRPPSLGHPLSSCSARVLRP